LIATTLPERLLVIGAGGFLGGRLMRSRDPRFEFIGLNRTVCDVTSPGSVRNAVAAARPEIVVLCAALADIDRCEQDPGLARSINVEGAKTVAGECARSGVRLMFLSSGAVFDGTAESYQEVDPPHPLSVYGKTKAEAEQAVLERVPDAVIVRLSLALGFSPYAGTNALLDKLQAALAQGNLVFAPEEEYRNAIDATTLTNWILDLASARDAAGIFHLGSADAMSRYQIVRSLAEAIGYSPSLVVSSNGAAGRAPRGRRHMLVPARIQQFSRVPVPTCMEAIERCIHDHA